MVFICLSCKHVDKTYYPNGVLESDMLYRHGKLDGRSVWYYEHGKKRMEIDYVSGKKNGVMYRYFRNGNLEFLQYFKNDAMEGISEEYNEKGILICKLHYKNGVKNGKYFEYYDDGALRIEGEYSRDMYDGIWKYYDEEGFSIGEAAFSDGSGTLKIYDANENLIRTVPYTRNAINGDVIDYDKNGKIEKVSAYDMGRFVEIKIMDKNK